MYEPFRIITVDSDLKNKRLVISTNRDIDPDSANELNIQVFEKSSRNILGLNLKVEGKNVIAEFDSWPIVNTEYILKVNSLKDVLGEMSLNSLNRKIVFKSDIINKVKIISPTNFDTVESTNIIWDEILEIEQAINSYYLEVSDDIAFHNIIISTEVIGKNTFNFVENENKQYFCRCRVQKQEEYGLWSDVVTFNVNKLFQEKEDIYAPVFEKDLEIIKIPNQGTTPKSIIIEFNDLVDSDSINGITIRRSDL